MLCNRCIACCLLICFLGATAHAAAPEDFKTPEYFASRALEIINAADAYALGYTGRGQTVGVLDTAVRIDHPELAGKADSYPLGFIPDWNELKHGSHVAGIIAANRDGIGMHGVAFDAGIWSAAILNTPSGANLDDYFARRPDVRIFNNSWGPFEWSSFLDEEDGTDMYSAQDFLEYMEDDPDTRQILLHAINSPESVFVFSSGNEGHPSPGMGQASLPRFGGSKLGNWLSVGSLNIKGITSDESGGLVVSPSSVSWFSNLAQGAELFTVMAPGSNIYSLNAETNGYMLDSGTSMAAPVVSGALALVAQAYPWMSGKQLADTVLTTANSEFEAPEYIVSFESNTPMVHIVSIDGGISSNLSPEDAEKLVKDVIDADPTAWIDLDDYALYVVREGNYDVLQMTKEEVFGQGILDVGKAVRGIARLDANRMTADDVTALDELGDGRQDALETFDTQGYVAEFSNDISQRTWEDRYHHLDYQTGGNDPELTADADALADINRIGLRKTGDGMLVLSGANTYKGATVVDGGILAVARRADGTGGVLENSDVLVRENGVLMGDGEIKNNVVNGGTVIPGFSGTTLTVGEYEQSSDGQLVIQFDSLGEHNSLSVSQTAALDGDLLFRPEAGQFYSSNFTVSLNNLFEAKNIQGEFDAFRAEDLSPTLETSLLNYDPNTFSGEVRMTRPADAYSRYAATTGAASLGRALTGVAATAQGDMRHLLASLDWSKRDGSDVRRALNQLGPEAYDASARASLGQQKEFNVLLLRRMLAGEQARRAAKKQAAAGRNAPAADNWQAWATPYGAGSWQGDHGSTSGWSSAGIGLLAGMDRSFDSGLTIGFHLGITARRTRVHGDHDATADTESGLVGVQGLLAPEEWDGCYLTAQARLGLERGEMNRNVSFNGYSRHNESDWTGLTGSALLGGGKDWTLALGEGSLSLGPVGWLEYSFLHRPSISEQDGQASRLHLDDTLYDSLQLSLGAHVGWATVLENRSTVNVDLLAAWRHELLDGAFSTSAAFRGYSASGFSSDTKLTGRDALMLQGGLRMTHANGVFMQAEVGGELFRTRSGAVNAGLSLGWEF